MPSPRGSPHRVDGRIGGFTPTYMHKLVQVIIELLNLARYPVPAIRGIDVFPIDSSLKSRYGRQKLVYCIGIFIVQAMDTSHTLIERLLHSRRLILECFQLAFQLDHFSFGAPC